ncbi:hypothetical protein AVEN_135956-1 [Araneus ventricosus]|uniref:Uncharacterized protein n=1 Tax=Araneus ventricosus TaxID=182803 RepID=A0A4Y2LA90_ARAVE|nr:hypothetical protein AVEN_135956-1 [Araneus ventricosus]
MRPRKHSKLAQSNVDGSIDENIASIVDDQDPSDDEKEPSEYDRAEQEGVTSPKLSCIGITRVEGNNTPHARKRAVFPKVGKTFDIP